MLQPRFAAILASVMAMALAGCGAAVHQISSAAATSVPSHPAPTATPSAAASQSSPPPPVSASTLIARCVTGFVTLNPSTGQAVSFVPFTDLSAYHPSPYAHGGYRLTLTGGSPSTAEVDGFSVVFNENGSEVGSATKGPFTSPKSLAHGQTLTWTETTDAMNVGAQGAVATDDTCELTQTRP
jgi:hypothetical protein